MTAYKAFLPDLLFLMTLLVMAACGGEVASGADANTMADASTAPASFTVPAHLPDPIAAAYRKHAAELPAGKAFSYHLQLSWGGNERFRGSVTQTPSMNRIVMRRDDDGAELRYDGTEVALVSAPDADSTAVWKGARFAAFTWPYFFAAPAKLADPGTKWDAPRDYAWTDGQSATAAQLTFEAGTGDAPDDYYVVFPDSQQRVAGMAYVVTFSKPDADINELTPHAIKYHDYRLVDDVPVAHRWTFHNWTEAGGLEQKALGEATLTDVHFVDVEEAAYATAGGVIIER